MTDDEINRRLTKLEKALGGDIDVRDAGLLICIMAAGIIHQMHYLQGVPYGELLGDVMATIRDQTMLYDRMMPGLSKESHVDGHG